MAINFCDLCNEPCVMNGTIGSSNMQEIWRTLVAQALCNISRDLTPGNLISEASTNATVAKDTAGTLGFLAASNVNADERYLKIYDKATPPVVGTDVPKYVFLIPGNTTGAGTNIPIPTAGLKFVNGIGLALTTGPANSDTGAVGANEIVVNYGYH